MKTTKGRFPVSNSDEFRRFALLNRQRIVDQEIEKSRENERKEYETEMQRINDTLEMEQDPKIAEELEPYYDFYDFLDQIYDNETERSGYDMLDLEPIPPLEMILDFQTAEETKRKITSNSTIIREDAFAKNLSETRKWIEENGSWLSDEMSVQKNDGFSKACNFVKKIEAKLLNEFFLSEEQIYELKKSVIAQQISFKSLGSDGQNIGDFIMNECEGSIASQIMDTVVEIDILPAPTLEKPSKKTSKIITPSHRR